MSARGRSIDRSIEIAATAEDVWRAISDADALVRWFPLEARVDPGVGGSIWISWGGDLAAESRIELWEPGRRLRTVVEIPGEQQAEPIRLAMDFQIESGRGSTTLRIVHSGFSEDSTWDDEFHGTSRGWRWFLLALRHYLEHHGGTPRVPIAARARVSLTPQQAWERLLGPNGLRAQGTLLSDLEPGRRFGFVTATGHRLEGAVLLYDPPFQFAGTLSNLENGLVLAEVEVGLTGTSPSLLLSLFGVDDARVESYARAWPALLDPLFPPGSSEAMGNDFKLARGLNAADFPEGG